MRLKTFLSCIFIFVLCEFPLIQAQSVSSKHQISIDRLNLPATTLVKLDNRVPLNVSNAPLKDIFRAIGIAYNINLSIDETIVQSVTIRLNDIPVIDAIVFLCDQYRLNLIQRGSIFRIERPAIQASVPKPLQIQIEEGKIKMEVSDEELTSVLKRISELSGKTIVPEYGVKGKLTGFIEGAPLRLGLAALLSSNGYTLRETSDIWYVDYAPIALLKEGGAVNLRTRVLVKDNKISLDVINTPIIDILEYIKAEMESVDLVIYKIPTEATITARVENLGIEECFQLLFRNTNITYYKQGKVFIVAEKNAEGMASTKLIPLDHVKTDSVLELLTGRLSQNGKVQVVKEQNGILVTGPQSFIYEVERVMKEIDVPTPQILIEALVVDFSIDKLSNFGMLFGTGSASDSLGKFGYGFGLPDKDGNATGYTLQGGGNVINQTAHFLETLLGISAKSLGGPLGAFSGFIGKLPSDFYFRINALSQQGKANVRSRPQISTLNGHKATLTFGETQYFLLNTSNYYGNSPYILPNTNNGNGNTNNNPNNPNNPLYPAVTQQFQTIEANVTFEITPWVGTTGEITAEIKPDFQTPKGGFKQGVPPTISSRSLVSTVRLKDGETIVLGGLIQEQEQITEQKVPILGSIPGIGKLFRNKNKTFSKQELIIFVTPHVFYGDGRDEERWRQIRQQFDSFQYTDPKSGRLLPIPPPKPKE